MPNYRFHTGPNQESGLASVELTGPDAACLEICRYTSDRLRDAGSSIFDRELRTVVTDDNGMVLYTVFVVGVASPAALSLRREDRLPASPRPLNAQA